MPSLFSVLFLSFLLSVLRFIVHSSGTLRNFQSFTGMYHTITVFKVSTNESKLNWLCILMY